MHDEKSNPPVDRLIEWTGERCVPWTDDLQVIYEHYHRYLFTRPMVHGKRVLDLASGAGYGAALLAEQAEHVVGLELDPASVAHSQQTYASERLEFVEGTMLDLSRFPAGSFDVVTCFEALEHVAEHDELLRQVTRVLAPDGVFLTSTPDRLIYADELHQHNPHHVRELSLAEFRQLLDEHFAHVGVWGQAVAVGSVIREVDPSASGPAQLVALEHEGEQWMERPDYPPTYYVGVASAQPLHELPAQSVLVDRNLELVRAAQRTIRDRDDVVAQQADALAVRVAQVEEITQRAQGLVEHLAVLDRRDEASRTALARLDASVAEAAVEIERVSAERDRALSDLAALRESRAHRAAFALQKAAGRLASTRGRPHPEA